jgi:hypothetical protein
MTGRRLIWFELLKRHRRPFLQYLREQPKRSIALSDTAIKLTAFLGNSIQRTEEAAAFWNAVPAVLERCDEQDTYDLEMASEAYAWVHLLDRYVRTWLALETMVQRACLPLAANGVNVLDVGTGPGPSTLAITHFYNSLSEYANAVGEKALVQPCRISVVELSWENNAFRSRFREATMVPMSEDEFFDDVRDIDPREQRAQIRRHLLDETEYNPKTGYEEAVCLPETADSESQGRYRYRLVTLSNFLTNFEIMKTAHASLEAILSDLQPGSVVLAIGGMGAHYPAIYQHLDEVATRCGLQPKIVDERVASLPQDTRIIVEAARGVARQIERLCPMTDAVPGEVRRALDRGDRWGRASTIRVYRRNKYPVLKAA